ncbi:PAQR family membrane homeostasis protein TrhA [Mycolicibacterium sp. 050158]|uniref:PAQR family membrane homeostasis protein TrhA n=1 Tax=Mycolicibacterium sp. 050158 TaxID=3090602 RepID=UPI00299DE0D3|nr:hemolysin III family protein [Mycolicibacterium sp. 050158]MDX1892851.1 hemolysin III family protein [Mycolicibacterium sp. 050158]
MITESSESFGTRTPSSGTRTESSIVRTAAADGEPDILRGDDDLPQVLADTVVDFLHAPRARGVIHAVCAIVATIAGAVLVQVAWLHGSPTAGVATLVYTATIVGMFSVSAVYHRVQWKSRATRKWMKRADHSMIFVFIAGSYTPFALLAMPPQTARLVLTIVYGGAAAGVALKMFWPSSPRWVGVPLYLLLGYAAIWFAPVLLAGGGVGVVALLIAGGVLYNIGAVLYGVRWPNPWPQTFGYHEFFHAFTAAAAICHYAAIWLLIL